MKKNFKRLINRNLGYKKYLRKNVINYMSNGKVMIVHLMVGLIKKILYKMSQYFPKPYWRFGEDINVKVDLSKYATKTDIKNITHVDTSGFALKTNLVNRKTKVDNLDIDKLVPVPTDLSKLSNVVKNKVVKKIEYNAKYRYKHQQNKKGIIMKTLK